MEISKEQLEDLLSNNTLTQTCKQLDISLYKLKKLAKKLNIDITTCKKFRSFEQMLKEIQKEDFEQFYSSHSKEDTMEYFRVGSTVFLKYLKYYDIKKHKEDILKIRESTCQDKYGVKSVAQLEDSKVKSKQTRLLKYGDENFVNAQKALQTKLYRYGDSGYHNINQMKQTNMQRYGVQHAMQSSEIREKASNTKLERYGDADYHNIEQMKKTNLQKYGVEYNFASKDESLNGRGTQKKIREITGDWNNREQAIKTCLERYGDDFFIKQIQKMMSSISSKGNSNINKEFEAYLMSKGILYKKEFIVDEFIYDFKLGNYLLELNPYATHNSSWGIFSNPKDYDYHRRKTLTALQNGFICVHVFDWIDVDSILWHILEKDLQIIDTGKPVRHIFDTKEMKLTNKENDNTVIIYDDGFSLSC